MKKLLFIASFSIMSFFAVANTVSKSDSRTITKDGVVYTVTNTYQNGELFECTVTATVDVAGTGVKISSTKPTCAEAARDVKAGVREMVKL
ncbi:MAG: hypothetical protein IE931_15050 [Sphingobacteriales bacterium]|nr:hypothetical protein [Sphingobacteriales bacterium]